MIITRDYSCLRKLICSKCYFVRFTRCKSSIEPKTKTYSNTILFPKTAFPTRSNNIIKEEIQKTAQFSELYTWQRQNLNGPEYVLQDGPPYANGDLHMGHAVNKILKDINNRSRILQGTKIHFVPGWDCHGLPIELKALQKQKSKAKELTDPVLIRETARNFALETVQKQKDVFKSWGVMADWDNCYLTLNKSYVQNQLHQFHTMYERGLIFRALKPVYWSPSTRTALAEAELEYDPQHKSTEVYVSFPIEKPPKILQDKLNGESLSLLIWTTTPWTLVANKAICYNPHLKYSCVSIDRQKGLFIVCTELIEQLQKILGAVINTVVEFDGELLSGTTYSSSLPMCHSPRPLLPAGHVTSTRGTGLVHTAPAHGPDDFLVAINNSMRVECNVDEAGRYVNINSELDGLYVLSEGQEAIISLLGDQVLYRGIYVHSYPLDWRTKQPVILRASDQWFIDTASIKERALEALEKVSILPPVSSEQSRQAFKAQVEKRPYWCISRQRAWGVPIPAFYHGQEVIIDKRITDNLCNLIEQHGTDVWWTSDVTQLLPRDVIKEKKLDVANVNKGRDILDIWFDSGIAWSNNSNKQASLYCEGLDQVTGWFQASLLTSIALTGEPPYKSIFVHGFVLDDKKRKMSKSIGNVIDPVTIVLGGKNKNNEPAYGIDTLRWWVASHSTQHSQIIVSKKLLDDCQTEVIRIRNILKYLLGVTSDLKKEHFNLKPNLNAFDHYMVNETQDFLQQIHEHYNNFRYNHVAQNVLHFISNKVSGLYCHCVKDRLYCSDKDYEGRIAAQLVSHTILVSICKALGPILPHLTEETWLYHPLKKKPFFFSQTIPVLRSEKLNASNIDTILEMKKQVCGIAKNENIRKFSAFIKLSPDLYGKLKDLNFSDGVNDSVLCEILELASITLVEDKNVDRFNVQLSVSKFKQCLRCRKFNAVDNSDKCVRCSHVVDGL